MRMGGDSCMVLPRREGAGAGTSGTGIVPLESRVRVGCVARLYRLAVELIGGWQATAIGYVSVCENVVSRPRAGRLPGVHTLGALTLTDTETQQALTLRYSITLSRVLH